MQVSIGVPSRISTKPRSISAAKSFGSMGDSFVRPALMSRIAQRSRIAVSRLWAANTALACSAIVTGSLASFGGSMAGTRSVALRGISQREYRPMPEVYPDSFLRPQPVSDSIPNNRISVPHAGHTISGLTYSSAVRAAPCRTPKLGGTWSERRD